MHVVAGELRAKFLIVRQPGYPTEPLSRRLSKVVFGEATFENLPRAFDRILNQTPDLILIDAVLGATAGLDFCSYLKSNRFTSHIPIVSLGKFESVSERLRWFQSGADACVDEENEEELLGRIDAILRRDLPRDELTKLPLGAHLHQQLDARLANGIATAVLYATIDHFQEYIAAKGQAEAAAVLNQLASLIVDALPRDEGVEAAYFGADSFMALLPPDHALTAAGTLVTRFASLFGPTLTLSVAWVSSGQTLLPSFVKACLLLTRLMSQAKALGGNRAVTLTAAEEPAAASQ